MAVTQTTLSAAARIVSWQSFPDPSRVNSPQPRGEMQFLTEATALTDGGVGNEMMLAGVFTLPRNFSYTLLELLVRISKTAAGTNNFENSLGAEVIDDNDGTNQTVRFQFEMVSVNVCSLGTLFETKLYTPVTIPKVVMIAPGGEGPAEVSIRCLNRTQADADYAAALWARFAIFDIEQAHFAEVNTPVLIR